MSLTVRFLHWASEDIKVLLCERINKIHIQLHSKTLASHS